VLNNILDKSHQSWSWVTGGRNISGVGRVGSRVSLSDSNYYTFNVHVCVFERPTHRLGRVGRQVGASGSCWFWSMVKTFDHCTNSSDTQSLHQQHIILCNVQYSQQVTKATSIKSTTIVTSLHNKTLHWRCTTVYQ